MATYTGDGNTTSFLITPSFNGTNFGNTTLSIPDYEFNFSRTYSFTASQNGNDQFQGSDIGETVDVAPLVGQPGLLQVSEVNLQGHGGNDHFKAGMAALTDGLSRLNVYFQGDNGTDKVELDFSTADFIKTEAGGTLTYTGQDLTDSAGTELIARISTDSTEILDFKGSKGDDQVYGLSGNDWLDGYRGNDTYHGSTGDDNYVFSTIGDTVIDEVANGGKDSIWASISVDLRDQTNIENIRLYSGNGLTATGNEKQNIITGNAQDNIITGGLSYDKLAGKGGTDTFVYAEFGGANRDLIVDFDANDKIRLDGSVFTGLDANNNNVLDVGAFVVGSAATSADAQIIYNSATGMISYDADGTGSGLAQSIVRVGTGLAFLDNGDFLIA